AGGRAADPGRRQPRPVPRPAVPPPPRRLLADRPPHSGRLGSALGAGLPRGPDDRAVRDRPARGGVSPRLPDERARASLAARAPAVRRPVRLGGGDLQPVVRGRPPGDRAEHRPAGDLLPGAGVRVAVAAQRQPVGAGVVSRGLEPVDGRVAREYFPAQVTSESRVGAFFDVDHTLIACNSARKWVEYLWRNGQISVRAALRSVWWLVKYRLSVLDYEAVTAEVVSDYAGKSVDELAAEVEAWFHANVEPLICVEGRERIEWHRAQGHTLVLLTSGTFFSVAPLQRTL